MMWERVKTVGAWVGELIVGYLALSLIALVVVLAFIYLIPNR